MERRGRVGAVMRPVDVKSNLTRMVATVWAVAAFFWPTALTTGEEIPSSAFESQATANRSTAALRGALIEMLGIPSERCALVAESRGAFEHDGIVVEKWVLTMEPGSKATAALYRPKAAKGRMPAIVLTFGHGGSKSQWQYNFAGQLYARLGLACLAIDPIGEEERHVKGKLGTRAHDPAAVHERADAAGRLIMGKLVFDTMRGIDYLLTRDDIDPDRIGVSGNSLGGAKATWMLAVEPRIRMAIVSGWAFDDSLATASKLCTRVPIQRMRKLCTWPEYLSLAADHCAVLAVNGDADVIIDREGDGTAWRGTRTAVDGARPRFEEAGGSIRYWFEPGGGHRPYMTYKVALEWIHEHLGTPGWDLEKIRAMPTVNSQVWMERNGVKAEKLYGTKLHQYGASLPDLGIRLIPREQLACLRENERGADSFTLQGWVKGIE